MRARRSSSPMMLRATERLVWAWAIAAVYAAREPPKRAATSERSAAAMSEDDTCAARCSTARANAFENASSGSPLSLRIGVIADQVTAVVPSLQRRPGAERLPELPVPVDRAAPVDQRRGEVDLAHDAGDVGDVPPPVARGAVGVRLRVHEQPRLCAALAQRLQEEQHVRAVLRIRGRPRHVEPGSEQ